MFKELDLITLTVPTPLNLIWDIPGDSPLLKDGELGEGLLPGDVGTILYVQGNGKAFEVEFLEPSGYSVAIATIYSSDMRPATKYDLGNDRFWKKVQV